MGLIGKTIAAGALLAVTSVGAVAPAQAHDGAAVVAGIVGLGVGAAIASDHHHHARYYEDEAPPPPPPGYYAPPPPPPPAYGYGEPYAYGYDYAPHCRVVPRWDGWAGRYVPVRHCR